VKILLSIIALLVLLVGGLLYASRYRVAVTIDIRKEAER